MLELEEACPIRGCVSRGDVMGPVTQKASSGHVHHTEAAAELRNEMSAGKTQDGTGVPTQRGRWDHVGRI
jgi:hypothetical protein